MVQDEINSFTGVVHCIEVENVGFAEINVSENLFCVVMITGCEVVDATHLFAAREQSAGQ